MIHFHAVFQPSFQIAGQVMQLSLLALILAYLALGSAKKYNRNADAAVGFVAYVAGVIGTVFAVVVYFATLSNLLVQK